MQFKEDFGIEKYVKLNLERNQRSILAQLRCGILPIHIETGRFTNIKAENRFCSICKTDQVEDEYHFLFHCNQYKDEREQFYTEIDTNFKIPSLPDPDKMNILFEYAPRKLSKFACKIFSKRQNIIYPM